MIHPVAALLGLPASHVYANTILFDGAGAYAGFDRAAFTSRSGGKARHAPRPLCSLRLARFAARASPALQSAPRPLRSLRREASVAAKGAAHSSVTSHAQAPCSGLVAVLPPAIKAGYRRRDTAWRCNMQWGASITPFARNPEP